ncbi:hypothetical protein PSYMO_36745, partial [Pseudomonas amygdali pv. mori str. 301020]
MTSIAFGLLLVSLIRTRVAAVTKANGSTGLNRPGFLGDPFV